MTTVADLKVEDYDAVVLPGGYGAAKNLSSFAVEGAGCSVDKSVSNFLKQFHEAGNPIGFACISPAIAAKVFGEKGVRLTIGNDDDTAAALEANGAQHVTCPVEEFVIDEELKIVSTPAYMLGPKISDVETGITRWINAVLALTG